jgi:hypothetical protein
VELATKASQSAYAINLARYATTFDELRDNDSTIRELLGKMTGDLKVVGWEAKDYGDGTYLVTYSFVRDGETRVWSFDVNTKAQIVRSVANDESLVKKYGFQKITSTN